MSSVSQRRFAQAVLALALPLAALSVGSVVHKAAEVGAPALSGSYAQDAAEQLDECAKNPLPDGFEQEALSLQGAQNRYVEGSGDIVGFTEKGSVEEILTGISDELIGKGWTEVDSGVPGCASFVKEGGSYRWLLIQCSQVGESVCVVAWSRRGSDSP